MTSELQLGASGSSCRTQGARYRKTSTPRSTPILTNDTMIPHTLVLKPGLVIHSIYNGYWYWGRPSIDDLWRDLRQVTQEIRPDWDLAAPGVRENYEGGDRSMHYAYQEADLRPRPG